MIKTILLPLAIFFAGHTAEAQQTVRIGYVDMEYILENVPEYQEASAQLERKVLQWKQEIETELQRIEKMKLQLENEKPLLTQELIEEREETIRYEEQQILDYQQKRFGPRGDLMTHKLQLVQPIQDQVFIAVQEIAESRDYDLIFDKSSDIVTLYAAERLDVSDQVLRLIERASRREELESKREKKQLLREEEKTVEEISEITEREEALQQKIDEREALQQERQRVKDSIRTARKKAIDLKRARIQQERQRVQDSIQKARDIPQNDN